MLDSTSVTLNVDHRSRPCIAVAGLKSPRVENGLLDYGRRKGWRLVSLEQFGGRLPRDLNPVGAIVRLLPDDPLVQQLMDMGCPVVRLGIAPHPQDARVTAVIEDKVAVGMCVAKYYHERGFQHLGYVGRVPWSDGKDYYRGLMRGAKEHGMCCHLLRYSPLPKGHPLDPDARMTARRIEFVEWIREIPKPLGLMAFGDAQGVRLCGWTVEEGLAVPSEVAVVGYRDHRFVCESSLVPLSSVARDTDALVRIAVDALDARIQGTLQAGTRIAVPPSKVVTRESTDVLAVSSPTVRGALTYMWEHVASRITVESVARHVGVSRRTLERAFQKDLGRGVNAELIRRRIELSCEMLRASKVPVAELAPQLGFGSKDYFQRAFRKTMGISPGQYRRSHLQDADAEQ